MKSIIIIGLFLSNFSYAYDYTDKELKLYKELKRVNVELWMTQLDLIKEKEDKESCVEEYASYREVAGEELDKLIKLKLLEEK